MLNKYDIADLLPQKHPFVFVDQVLDFKKDCSLTAIKTITTDEWIGDDAEGLFPEVLVVEVAAQAAIALLYLSREGIDYKSIKPVLGKVNVEYHKQAFVGDVLKADVKAVKMLKDIGIIKVNITAASKKIADVDIHYSVLKKS